VRDPDVGSGPGLGIDVLRAAGDDAACEDWDSEDGEDDELEFHLWGCCGKVAGLVKSQFLSRENWENGIL
jgi:hypothetical protein